MAFIGADGMENQIRQLKNQLGGKGTSKSCLLTGCALTAADAELSSVRQEMIKHKEKLQIMQRDMEEESFQVSRERQT